MTHFADMTIGLFAVSATALYLLSLSMLWRGIFKRTPVNRTLLAVISFTAGSLHLTSALLLIFRGDLVDLSLFTTGSLIFAATGLIITLSSLRTPIHILLFVVQPLALLLILLGFFSPTTKLVTVSPGVSFHILSSILAYGVIFIALASSIVMSYASYRLKHRQASLLGTMMPPIETIDRLTFEMLVVGELLLTLSIASGFLFVEDFFGQQLIHKTFFSLLSWVIFAILLVGHVHFGWRGTRTLKWTIAGFIMLLLGYVGSKFVIELILA